ncbi:Aste57867_15120 [Aphanomyces stellatus]|uniref:Aste57867_15120 protein n=1 Tax=Aphanomyces stellatus TaxID=120398 RepID=A0A485L2F0_9STRA|nr:hypothetical protein As57867_015064 [Aphanomyces stellatus]VFT91930.1 Aste57867_15120 [Aphanomyces stellatus]
MGSIASQPRSRLFAVISGAALLLVLYIDLAHSNSILVKQATSSSSYFRAHYIQQQYKQETPVCRIQFVFTGTKYDYDKFPMLQSWLQYADPKCAIELVRANHAFVDELTPAERAMFDDSAYLPILQADFMKLLVLYYLGGLVTDLDVSPMKRFPDDWTGPNTALATCDVVLGSEVSCFTDECASGYVRKGQIQNWSMWARHRHSPFLGELIGFVVDKYKTFPVHDKDVAVQEVAGSGPITDFVNRYSGLDVPYYDAKTSKDSNATLASDYSKVFRMHKYGEEVCIVGTYYTGGPVGSQAGCRDSPEFCMLLHAFEGSWRHG